MNSYLDAEEFDRQSTWYIEPARSKLAEIHLHRNPQTETKIRRPDC